MEETAAATPAPATSSPGEEPSSPAPAETPTAEAVTPAATEQTAAGPASSEPDSATYPIATAAGPLSTGSEEAVLGAAEGEAEGVGEGQGQNGTERGQGQGQEHEEAPVTGTEEPVAATATADEPGGGVEGREQSKGTAVEHGEAEAEGAEATAVSGLFGQPKPSVPMPPPPGSVDGLQEILETTRMLEAKERGLGRKYLAEAIAARQDPKKKTWCGDSSSMLGGDRCGDSSAMVTENHHDVDVAGTTTNAVEFLFCANRMSPSDCCDEEAGESHLEHEAPEDGDDGAWEEGKADDGDHDVAEVAEGPTQAEQAKKFWDETQAMKEAEAELAAAAAAEQSRPRNVRFRSIRKASARATGLHGLFAKSKSSSAKSSSEELAQLKAEAEAAAPTTRAP
uniref:Uncharacterized protein n=1 Tax=Florenciella parvula TaxID=236787 RepID=A0A7S2CBA5_9STRA|mmetsp:Transcript_27008/g.55545  ORF Transcript_27008/g.55545 Transcript_27008/m.55545 type:complete len:396 (+) Transcript_27008:147-1334(+)